MSPIKRVDLKILGLLLGLALIPAVRVLSQQPRVVEVIADKDEHFKIPGQKKQVLTLKANELSCYASRRTRVGSSIRWIMQSIAFR